MPADPIGVVRAEPPHYALIWSNPRTTWPTAMGGRLSVRFQGPLVHIVRVPPAVPQFVYKRGDPIDSDPVMPTLTVVRVCQVASSSPA